MSMGHIIIGLAIHIVLRKLTFFAPLEREIFNEDFFVRFEIITNFGRLQEADNRRCYQLRQTALRCGDVPLPKVVQKFDNVSKEEEEDVKPHLAHKNARMNKKDGKIKAKKNNRAAKRKRFKDSIERVEKKIEDVVNRTDKRLSNMMMDVITKFEVYETLRDVRMDNLMAEEKELKQLISQSKGAKASTEPSVEIIILETSSSNASN